MTAGPNRQTGAFYRSDQHSSHHLSPPEKETFVQDLMT